VTILNCIDNLDKHAFHQLIFLEECELPNDGVKIASIEVIDKESKVDCAWSILNKWHTGTQSA
jgi:hypothetical protein